VILKYHLEDKILLFRAIIKGILTYIPLFERIRLIKKKNSKHSGSNALFCYTIWLSILIYLKKNNANKIYRIGELGTGGAIGIGICAMLTGMNKYYVLDIEGSYNIENNLKLLADLVTLFKKETPIIRKFKQLNLTVDNNAFPRNLIMPLYLDDDFVAEIKEEILSGFKKKKKIIILNPWMSSSNLNLDFIFSRAVMEHVDKPEIVYSGLTSHIIENGFMLHDIEFHSHGISKYPCGHQRISNTIWKLISGKRKYFLNRWKFDDHLKAISEIGFETILAEKTINNTGLEDCVVGGTFLAKKVAV